MADTPTTTDNNGVEHEIEQTLADTLDSTMLCDEDLCASVNMSKVLKQYPEVQVVPIAQMYKITTPDETWAYNPADGLFRNAVREELNKIEFYAQLTGYPCEVARVDLANPEYWYENSEIAQKKKRGKAEPGYTFADLDLILPAITWLWEPWLPKGMVTLITSDSGVGKSALALGIAAAVIQYAPWPDQVSRPATPKLVVWVETENAHAITRERIVNWGIPKDKLLLPAIKHDPLANFWLDTEEGWGAVEKEILRDGVGLVVIDSLRGAHRSDENASTNIELLNRLAELSQHTQISILVLHHLRKKGLLDDGKLRLDRVRGSSAIVQIPRCVWGLDRPDSLAPQRVRLQQLKNNLARFPEPLGFEVTDDELIYTNAPSEPIALTPREKAANLLLLLLRSGPMPTNDIYDEAEGAGISRSAVRGAKEALRIVAKREGGQKGHWTWALSTRD